MSMITNRPQTEHGASIKLLLIVERTLTDIVTVEGNNLQTGEPLWFIVNGEQAATTLRLDPEWPTIPFQHRGYAEFPGSVLLSEPGCYVLRATTSSEQTSWQKTFVVTK